MKTVIVTDAHAEKMVKEAYENFPEASISLDCVLWNYGTVKNGKPFRFKFVDREEDGKLYEITLVEAVKGFHVFVGLVLDGKLPGLSLGPDWLTDTGDWDGDGFDALAQCAIFGGVIYG